MTLLEFLRARLDEDEAAARRAVPGPWATQGVPREAVVYSAPTGASVALGWIRDLDHVARHDPARVLAEVDAKRRLIGLAFEHASTIDGEFGCCHDAGEIERGLCRDQPPDNQELLCLLALPYAEHSDYQAAWRP